MRDILNDDFVVPLGTHTYNYRRAQLVPSTLRQVNAMPYIKINCLYQNGGDTLCTFAEAAC